MKTIILSILLMCNTLYSQTVSNFYNSSDQTNYYRSQLNELRDQKGNNIISNSTFSDSLVLSGESSNNYFGVSVSSAGDVNGDGYSDVIIGAYGYSNTTGRAYIFFGGIIMDNIADVTFTTDGVNYRFGYSVSTIGDVNGDGFTDVIVGASNYSSAKGRAYIYFGGLSMDNNADIILTGESSDSFFGYSVSTAGDVNGDGYFDVIVGAYLYNGGVGRAYIFYGGTSMNNIADVIITGEGAVNELGFSVSTAGDVNGDGYSDVIVGAYVFNNNTGRVYIFYGGLSMDNIADVTMTGETSEDKFGWSVSTAADVNGDGYSDVIIGADEYELTKGRVYIYYGDSSMNNIADVIITGEATDKLFGYSVSNAGDVNCDGFSDIIIGAPGYGSSFIGKAYICYGGMYMDNIVDVKMRGLTGRDYFGKSVSCAGDVNGDGSTDIIVGSYNYYNGSGNAYLYFNASSKPTLINPNNNSINNSLAINFNWNKYIPSIYYIINISTDSTFNYNLVRDTIYSDTSKLISVFKKDTKYYWSVSAKDSTGASHNSSVWNFTTMPPIKINLKVLMEGMYSQVFNQLTRKDTITVYLRNSTTPYALVDSAKGTIDSITQTGLFNFVNASSGTYYIIAKHFNCIETWSKSGGENLIPNILFYNYDITSSSSQAFGNNLKQKGSKYCIYSGDINQDCFVSLIDLITIYNDASNFLSGRFLLTDLTGDNITDLADVTLCYNNASNFVGTIRP